MCCIKYVTMIQFQYVKEIALMLNKPPYIVMRILDLSKVLMFQKPIMITLKINMETTQNCQFNRLGWLRD